MNRGWIPAALMGALVIGVLAGRVSCAEGSAPTYETPAASAPAPAPATPVEPPVIEPPPDPAPDPEPDDGLAPYPAWNGRDLDCGDIRRPVRVPRDHDPHRLDNDGNGVGCESYR